MSEIDRLLRSRGFDTTKPIRVASVRRIEDNYPDNQCAPATLATPRGRTRGDTLMANQDLTCACGCGASIQKARWPSAQARFVQGHNRRIRQPYSIEDRGHDTPCWIWQRYLNPKGYGRMCVNGKTTTAHRHYYERVSGQIPEGMQIDHLCRQRACVNPAHLEPVSNAENSRRGRNAKLTTADAATIKRLLAETTLSQREIGERFGVSGSTISRIACGEGWA